jgi:hypothetical protein
VVCRHGGEEDGVDNTRIGEELAQKIITFYKK